MTRGAAERILLACALSTTGACASGPTFVDKPVVWRVDDTRDIEEPSKREFDPTEYYARIFVARRLTRTLELPDDDPALNTNALDEVPDSTWFHNRIGVRRITPEEAARGPVELGPPQLPLEVTQGKDTGGGNPGFFAHDPTGRVFLVKFDTKQNPEMQTATSVIVNRVFWTLGYNVPEDTTFKFRRDELLLAPGATTEDEYGDKRPMTPADVEEILATTSRDSEGRYRASASLLLPGTPKGGFRIEGKRRDDPNDRVAHEDRRELRALRVFAAWVGHTDMKEDNTLDMYVEEDGRRFLRHYLLDFGEALGAHQAEKNRLEDGYEHLWDWEDNVAAVFAFGLWKRAWEDQRQTPWPAIGAFGSRYFEPENWKEAYPYWPMQSTHVTDLYWGAKLVMRFDRSMLEAIVREGQLSDPRAAEYLVQVLLERRDKIGRAWLEALSPFDALRIEPGKLCGVDLGVRHGLARAGALLVLNESGDRIDEVRVARDGTVCLPIADDDEYRVLRLRIRRGEELKPPLEIHYKGGPRARILGVIRAPL